jgi:hypothetical protein
MFEVSYHGIFVSNSWKILKHCLNLIKKKIKIKRCILKTFNIIQEGLAQEDHVAILIHLEHSS